DEEIPAAEDHLWAADVRAPERVAYVPEAAVAHSHPMTVGEWRFRFYVNGVAAEYARAHGVALPWAGDALAGVVAGRACAGARTAHYRRGVRDGPRRYGRR